MKRICQDAAFLSLIVLIAGFSSGCKPPASVPPPAVSGSASAVSAFTEVPDPLSGDNPRYPLVTVEVPTPGQSLTDARFGTGVIRVGQNEKLRHEYSRHDPFNRDRTFILLDYFPDGEWRVYRTGSIPYDQTGNLVRTLNLAEPRWDPDDADVIWGFQEFNIVRVNVQSGQTSLVKDFAGDPMIGPILTANPDLYRVTMMDEGEPSSDMRYWGVLLQGSQDDYRGRYLFTWDRQQDRIAGMYPLTIEESHIDWVGMSPLGNWVLIGGDWDNGGKLTGLVMANRELTSFHQLDVATAHSDVGLDTDGREVIVMQSSRTDYIDMLPLDMGTKPVLDTADGYDDTGRVRLMRLYYDSESPLNLNSGVHISCNAPGFCVVSTTTEPDRSEQNWLDRTITLVRLDRSHPRVIYLAKVHGAAAAYWEETHATISRDAKKVVWATNWNRHVGEERVWLMELEIPPAWLAALAR
jgi:hypothetical protein